ncbi:hypothetical protein ACE3MZ_15930 [Paenibacillus sp. WLX1005]|uniref:hypothetical protein n=1 Tax=Paenibacillus TaxID=44249 RepID=UPI00345A65B0
MMENTQEQGTFNIDNRELDFMSQIQQIVSNHNNSDLAVRGKVKQLLTQYMETN